MKHKNILRIAIVTACLLLVPLVAMQFNDEMVWTLSDFVFAGALLFGAGLTYELVANRSGNIAYRVAVGLAVATALILAWLNLAVGIIGSEDNPANVMYVGVLVVGAVGAIIARFRPQGMARALFATAAAQMCGTRHRADHLEAPGERRCLGCVCLECDLRRAVRFLRADVPTRQRNEHEVERRA